MILLSLPPFLCLAQRDGEGCESISVFEASRVELTPPLPYAKVAVVCISPRAPLPGAMTLGLHYSQAFLSQCRKEGTSIAPKYVGNDTQKNPRAPAWVWP